MAKEVKTVKSKLSFSNSILKMSLVKFLLYLSVISNKGNLRNS